MFDHTFWERPMMNTMKNKLFQAVFMALVLAGNFTLSQAQNNSASTVEVPPPGTVTVARGVQGFQFVGAEPPISTQVVKGAPYSLEATIETVQTLADGNRIVHRQNVRLYRDSKGRIRREEVLAAIGPWASSGSPPTMITIQDPVSGASYFLDPQMKIANKMSAPPAGKHLMIHHEYSGDAARPDLSFGPIEKRIVTAPPGDEAGVFGIQVQTSGENGHPEEKTESLGKENIAGIAADGTRVTETIPANAMGNERPIEIARERWYSPGLKVVLRSKQADPRFGETSYEVTKIDRTEPASSLFEVPPDYKLTQGDTKFVIKRDHDVESK
jgi:hypothetical protein